MITRFPGVEYAAPPRAAAHTQALAWNPRLVVVHDTGNSSSSRYDEANYAATRTDPLRFWTSAHAYIDKGGVLGSLPLNLRAWSAFSYANANGFHIEICLRDLHDGAALTHAAAIVRDLCQAAGIPMRHLTPAQIAAGERGICGHADITNAHIDQNDHLDPDHEGFDWPAFMTMVTSGGGGSIAAGNEDDMGQSFGPITLEASSETSLCIPPVQAGAADKRAAWLNICNAATYALRVWISKGSGLEPLAVTSSGFNSQGMRGFTPGQRISVELPANTCGVFISRKALTSDGTAVEPNDPAAVTPPYTGHLTVCVERGPVLP